MLYKRIRELSEDNDLTQKKMGEILSCSQRVYSNYERGELDIPTDILIKLADYYDVSVDYLLERTKNKKTNKTGFHHTNDRSPFYLLFQQRDVFIDRCS